MFDRSTSLAVLALLGCWIVAPVVARAQDAGQAQPEAAPAVQPLPMPEPIPPVTLGPNLKPNPEANLPRDFVQSGSLVDTKPLPRERKGIWVMEMTFKPLRMRTVEIPGKGRRQIHYLYYRIVNRTGQPRFFVPQFDLVTDTGKTYRDSVLPQAVKVIQAREEPPIPLRGAVEITGMIPPSTKQGVDEAVYGVAIWEDVDPHADRLTVYVRGLSDGYQVIPAENDKPSQTKYKALKIDFIRRGDARKLNEGEIEFLDPNRPYEWTYF